jgi:hypothetical protein
MQSVRASLQNKLPASVASAEDPNLAASVQSLSAEPYIAWVWLVDADGKLIFHEGGPGKVGDSLRDFDEHNDAVQYVNSLPAGSLSDDQAFQLLAIGAMRTEGEHNDVFRQMVYPIRDAQNQTQAMVVVAYDANPSIGAPGTAYVLGILGWLAAMALFWLCLPLWVYFDARSRGESAVLWGLFVLVTNQVWLLAYLIGVPRPAR